MKATPYLLIASLFLTGCIRHNNDMSNIRVGDRVVAEWFGGTTEYKVEGITEKFDYIQVKSNSSGNLIWISSDTYKISKIQP